MENLPIKFPQDPYCRARSRLLLTSDEAQENIFLGVTPDGVQPGRDMLARLSLWREEAALPYTFAQEQGMLVLRCAGGCVRCAIALPDRLLIAGEGVSLLIGKGRALGMFMSGGSAVDDPLPGALYVNAVARMRILPRVGTVEVRSAWDLNALSDPDPRIFLHPDAQGRLEAEVCVTDFDAPPAEDALTPEAAAADTLADFTRFLEGLTIPAAGETALHAAYIAWSALQPVRALARPQISAPVFVANRRTRGTGLLSDNVLFAALLQDPAAALAQLGSFLAYADESGLVPCAADNRSRLMESETPLFGVVYKARPELIPATGAALYAAQKKAFGWWTRERWCPERKLFYYLHRFEPGCGRRQPFADPPPDFSPELNVCMRLWLDALAEIADSLGYAEEAAAHRAQAQAVTENLRARLWDASRWRSMNILDQFQAEDRGGGCMTALLPELAALRPKTPERIPTALALPLLLAGDAETQARVAAQVRLSIRTPLSLRQALTVLAAEAVERGCPYAD